MDQEPDVIRQHIDETRSSLTEKLETLEDQVRGTVEGAKATVEDTIESVKSTVQDTVDSVKRTFDLNYQVEQHPWPMVGGSLLAGFVLGSLLGGRGSQRASWGSTGYASSFGSSGPAPKQESSRSYQPSSNYSTPPASQPAVAQPSLFDKFISQFDDEIRQVKGMAVGAALGVLRDLAKQAVPPALAPQVEQIMDSATTKLGGKPVPGPVVEDVGEMFHSKEPTQERNRF